MNYVDARSTNNSSFRLLSEWASERDFYPMASYISAICWSSMARYIDPKKLEAAVNEIDNIPCWFRKKFPLEATSVLEWVMDSTSEQEKCNV